MNIIKSTLIISIITFFSRISGLFRDILITYTFGSNYLTDSFWIAFRIPNMLRRLLADGSFAQVLTPVISNAKSNFNEYNFQLLINKIFTILILFLIFLTVLGILFAQIIVSFIASGTLYKEDFLLITNMTRIMFPYIMFMSIVALYSCILNVWKKFFLTAFTPILLNIAIIFCCMLYKKSIYILSIGVLIGGFLQLLVQWLYLYYYNLSPKFDINIFEAWKDKNVQNILSKMLPAFVGVSIIQISLIINTNIATWLSTGSITYITLADRIMEFPNAMLGITLTTILLPLLSKKYYEKDYEGYNKILNWALSLVICIGIPIAIFMAILSEGLVSVLFYYGKFNFYDVNQTQSIVCAYSIGIISLISIKILGSAFYAMQDIKTPLKISIISLIITQFFNIIFVPIFDYVGLAISISLGAILNSLLLIKKLIKFNIFKPNNQLKKIIFSICPSAIILIICTKFINTNIYWISLNDNYVLRFVILISILLICLFIYILSLFIFGIKLKDFSYINNY
ncbi:putative lipid II flippase MurJ [Candidatus Kinetoplastibacterium sorsogonicusi]|uniref:Probable lipid II flippase MurJ n=1 Tax=Candidatus Kinetoplastidibacterium kentomonadis TaxID=1576550 RepID=A0A3S7J9N9_9PROT|nr:murein biosynthesis integral membrane protein MurJ [Candidatus Kinetoplastibacterium sorsogonicusi]AWD32392.1 putative lipid II flippase MurJ [Candidatus Kinetoplastibacterium sorsogonicusi]